MSSFFPFRFSFKVNLIVSINMWILVFGVFLLPVEECADSHYLKVFSTFIIGDTPFPQFSAVVMLDDIQMFYYDSDVQKLIYKKPNSEHNQEHQQSVLYIFKDQHKNMKQRATFFQQQETRTDGIHVQQKLAFCDLLENDTPGLLVSWYAFNGIDTGGLNFSMQHNTIKYEGVWASRWGDAEKKSVTSLYATVYSPVCIDILRSSLHIMKNDVTRRVTPQVQLFQKTLPDSGGAMVTCLATGFYPRHINLTLLRDDQPVSDHQMTRGELLPNGDETYQMRKSLEVSAEDLREKHQYSCTAEHLSLKNKLHIKLDLGGDVNTSAFACLLLVLLCPIALIMLRKRKRSSTTPTIPQRVSNEDDSSISIEGKSLNEAVSVSRSCSIDTINHLT